MSAEDLIRFARRDWTAVARAKEQHWLRQKRSMSPLELWRRTDELRRHAKSFGGHPSSMADRLADLQVHQRVAQALRALTHSDR